MNGRTEVCPLRPDVICSGECAWFSESEVAKALKKNGHCILFDISLRLAGIKAALEHPPVG